MIDRSKALQYEVKYVPILFYNNIIIWIYIAHLSGNPIKAPTIITPAH